MVRAKIILHKISCQNVSYVFLSHYLYLEYNTKIIVSISTYLDILTENLRSMELGLDKLELKDSDEISFEEGEIQEHLDPM